MILIKMNDKQTNENNNNGLILFFNLAVENMRGLRTERKHVRTLAKPLGWREKSVRDTFGCQQLKGAEKCDFLTRVTMFPVAARQ